MKDKKAFLEKMYDLKVNNFTADVLTRTYNYTSLDDFNFFDIIKLIWETHPETHFQALLCDVMPLIEKNLDATFIRDLVEKSSPYYISLMSNLIVKKLINLNRDFIEQVYKKYESTVFNKIAYPMKAYEILNIIDGLEFSKRLCIDDNSAIYFDILTNITPLVYEKFNCSVPIEFFTFKKKLLNLYLESPEVLNKEVFQKTCEGLYLNKSSAIIADYFGILDLKDLLIIVNHFKTKESLEIALQEAVRIKTRQLLGAKK